MKKNKLREKYRDIASMSQEKGKAFEVDNKNIGDKVVIIKKEKDEIEENKIGIFGKRK